jgi:hypothetical protein
LVEIEEPAEIWNFASKIYEKVSGAQQLGEGERKSRRRTARNIV